jgi:hypothetical protein
MMRGEKNGELWEWHAASGWKKVPRQRSGRARTGSRSRTTASGIYVAAWGSQSFFPAVARRRTPARDEIRLGFRVGQHPVRAGRLAAAPRAGRRRVASWVKINPDTMAVREIVAAPDDTVFRGGTVAVEIGNELWIGSFQGDRIAVITP